MKTSVLRDRSARRSYNYDDRDPCSAAVTYISLHNILYDHSCDSYVLQDDEILAESDAMRCVIRRAETLPRRNMDYEYAHDRALVIRE